MTNIYNVQSNNSIYNRDFFFFIGSSASMKRFPVSMKNQTKRFKAIQESVLGHINEVLSYHDTTTNKKVYSELTLAFFNEKKLSERVYKIIDLHTAIAKFADTLPTGDTYITPTFSWVLSEWLDECQDRSAEVIIYVDGIVDDRSDFIQEIKNIASKLSHHAEMHILIIGISDAINSSASVKWYFELSLNSSKFRTGSDNSYNLVSFDRMDDINESGGIISAVQRNIASEFKFELPGWLQEEFPDLYIELKEKYNL